MTENKEPTETLSTRQEIVRETKRRLQKSLSDKRERKRHICKLGINAAYFFAGLGLLHIAGAAAFIKQPEIYYDFLKPAAINIAFCALFFGFTVYMNKALRRAERGTRRSICKNMGQQLKSLQT